MQSNRNTLARFLGRCLLSSLKKIKRKWRSFARLGGLKLNERKSNTVTKERVQKGIQGAGKAKENKTF
jgi:hypothetical protein